MNKQEATNFARQVVDRIIDSGLLYRCHCAMISHGEIIMIVQECGGVIHTEVTDDPILAKVDWLMSFPADIVGKCGKWKFHFSFNSWTLTVSEKMIRLAVWKDDETESNSKTEGE